MIDPKQLLDLIVRPTLSALGETFSSLAAIKLIMLTMAHESASGKYIKQQGGPALGVAQMEPITHDDIWGNYLKYKPDILNVLKNQFGIFEKPDAKRLVYDLQYAVLMCRIHYKRVSEALPDHANVDALCGYWKQHYNTSKGKGRVEDCKAHYALYVEDVV